MAFWIKLIAVKKLNAKRKRRSVQRKKIRRSEWNARKPTNLVACYKSERRDLKGK